MDGERIMNIIETSEDGRYRVRLEQDTDAVNPRKDGDPLTHVITPTQQRYIDIDPDGGPLQYGWDYFSLRPDSEKLFTRWARMVHGAVVIEARPHDGAWALWYLTAEDVAEAGIPDPEECIRAEIEEYQTWAAGEVYAYIYIIERRVVWQRTETTADETMITWEAIEDGSCGGLVGYTYAEETARNEFLYWIDNGAKGESA